jgi:hypothetical protein
VGPGNDINDMLQVLFPVVVCRHDTIVAPVTSRHTGGTREGAIRGPTARSLSSHSRSEGLNINKDIPIVRDLIPYPFL